MSITQRFRGLKFTAYENHIDLTMMDEITPHKQWGRDEPENPD